MLWFLHLCVTEGIVVTGYIDHPEGTMVETADGGGHFERVVLRPEVAFTGASAEKVAAVHERAHHLCFIANSVNFPVVCEPA
jgi:organic hydroperoxide reductase OsmC/OhrA